MAARAEEYGDRIRDIFVDQKAHVRHRLLPRLRRSLPLKFDCRTNVDLGKTRVLTAYGLDIESGQMKIPDS